MKTKKKSPRYAIVDGYFKDDKSTFEGYVIKLSVGIDEAEDDRIFFYCHGVHELELLLDEATADEFVVTKYELTHEI